MCKISEIIKNFNLFDSLPVGVVITDTTGQVLYINNEFTNITGYTKDDIINKKIGKQNNILYSGYHEDEFYANLWEQLIKNKHYSGVVYNKTKDGTFYWQKAVIHSYKDENFIGYITNVNDQVENENFVRRIIDTSPGLIYIYDLIENKNIFLSKNSSEIIGYNYKEVQGLGSEILSQLIHKDDLEMAIKNNEKISQFKNGEVSTIQYRMLTKDGSYKYFRAKESVFLRDQNKKVIQKIGIAIDVTDEVLKDKAIGELSTAFNTYAETTKKLSNVLKTFQG